MNILLHNALAEGPRSSSFNLLLQNYGWWSRYFGCAGFKSHTSDSLPEVIIDDDTAMLVEQAAIKLRKSRPNVWRVFNLYYMKGLSQDEIANKIRRESQRPWSFAKRRRNVFVYNPATAGMAHHVTAETVAELLVLAARNIYSSLKDH